MAWLLLIVSGLLEVVWALGIRATDGFTRFWPSVYTVLTMGLGIYLLSLATRTLPIGTAYSVWTGIGAVGTAICGIAFFDEPRGIWRLASIGLIVLGIAGLRFSQNG